MNDPIVSAKLDRLARIIKKRQFDEAMERLIQRQCDERRERIDRARMPSDREDWADVEAAFQSDRPCDSGI